MSVKLEFINVLIPIEKINKCNILGGFERVLEIDKKYIGNTVWFDHHIYREGAMNGYDIDIILEKWTKRGLELTKSTVEGDAWRDLCVVDSSRGLTLSCDWLGLDIKKQLAWYVNPQKD